MDNLKLWEQVKEVPATAQKAINAGRLKGKTDINPVWRIKKLTEVYGECGFGWFYKIINKWSEKTTENDIAVFVEIELFVKKEDSWSQPIIGLGGNTLLEKENSGKLYTNDEAYKMALTDAIGVACKNLGMGASIYWSQDNTKYNDAKKDTNISRRATDEQFKELSELGADLNKVAAYYKCTLETLTEEQAAAAIKTKRGNK